jgi:hypothetical protein
VLRSAKGGTVRDTKRSTQNRSRGVSWPAATPTQLAFALALVALCLSLVASYLGFDLSGDVIAPDLASELS